MEAFERGVFVVGVNGAVGRAEILVELDEVRGKSAFPNTAFAVEDENEAFYTRLLRAWIRDAGPP